MKPIAIVLMFTAGAAQAHPGHLIELAGHGHWGAGAAIGIAIAIGLWGAVKGKGGEPEVEEIDEEPQEA